MKKYLILLATALLLGACASDDIPVGTQDSTQLADVTIMYYAHGGCNGVFVNGVTPDYTLEKVAWGNWGGTLQSVYGALAFDKATGWSRWLLLNEQQPSLWCNNDFKTPLPDISDKEE